MRDQSPTVMIVDDESRVTDIMHDILESRGYRILAATSPTRALALLSEDSRAVDVLLSDVVMPEMPGTELARLVQARWPACQVILMSGYFPQDLAARGLPPQSVVLDKPIAIATLLEAVSAALGRYGARIP